MIKSLSCRAVELLLSDYLDGELGPRVEARFISHLVSCEACSHQVKEVRKIVQAAKNMGSEPIPKDVSERLRDKLKKRDLM